MNLQNETALPVSGGTALDTTAVTSDFVTAISSIKKPDGKFIRLTKRLNADGSIEQYENAFSVKSIRHGVSSIFDINSVLANIQGMSHKAIIRGGFVGKEHVLPENNTRADGKALREGTYRRVNQNFPDAPHHWVMLDVDSYSACMADPVHDPETAAREFIEAELPTIFHGVTFAWQLSSSAGTSGLEGVLKIHLWFWLDKSWDSASLKVWADDLNAKAGRKLIDPAVFQCVQLHYCAAPVLEEGVADPVPERLGLWESPAGQHAVAFQLPPEMLVKAESERRISAAENLKDQSGKPGYVGEFYRAWPDWQDIVFGVLEGHFEEGSAEHRLTWVDADSGQPDGAWIAGQCEHHIGANHNSWPWGANRVTTLFDCVRVLKFGEADHVEDAFEQQVIESLPYYKKPSYHAMCAWMDEQPEVIELRREEAISRLAQHNDLEDEQVLAGDRKKFPLRTKTLSELLRLPPPSWLIKGVLSTDSLALVYGPSSVGKTFAVIDIALAIARGAGSWFDRRAKSGSVLYIAGEGGRGLVNRMQAYCQYHDLVPEEVEAHFYTGALNLLEAEEVQLAVETAQLMKPSLVIIDTLATTMPGGDESSAKDMTCYLDAAKSIRRASRACVLIVHHSGKNEAAGARGSSALRAAVDTEISITQVDEVRSMKVTKQRDGISGFQLGYQLVSVELGVDEDLESITSCVIEPADIPGQGVEKGLGKNQRLILEKIKELAGVAMKTTREAVIESAMPLLSVDPTRRREVAKQTLGSLAKSGLIVVDAEGGIVLPF